MKLYEYMHKLQRMVRENPGCLDLTVITGIDDGGNGFRGVSFPPAIGKLADDVFDPKAPAKEHNVVCLN